MVALLTVVLFAMCAFVVDLGQAYVAKRQLQTGVDAGALAAALAFREAGGSCSDEIAWEAGAGAAGQEAAETSLEDNLPGARPGTIDARCVDGRLEIGFSAESATDTVFARVLDPDRDQIDFGQQAAAVLDDGSPCALCVLESTSMSGSPDLVVTNAGVGLNGAPSFSSANVHVTDGSFTTERPSSGGILNPAPRVGVHVEDPFRNAPMPDISDLPEGEVKNGCPQGPGRYGDIKVKDTCELEAGLYAITGTLSATGNTTLDATAGVTLYFTCGSQSAPRECDGPEAGGSLDYAGNLILKIKAPDSGDTQGFAILYHPGNNADLTYSGTPDNVLEGAIYAASSTMNMSGNSGTTGIDSAIVVAELEMAGDAGFTLTYTQEANPRQTPVPALSR